MSTERKNLLVYCFVIFGFASLDAQSGLKSIANDSNQVYGGGYMEVQIRPKFFEDINKYIADSIRYPEEAKKKNIQGTVYISFIVEKDGSVTTVKVVRSDEEGLNNEAKRIVSTMPKWAPGENNGKPVRVSYMIPVHFKL